MTSVFLCGFECGRIDAALHVTATNLANAAFNTSTVRSGARSLRINPTNASGIARLGTPTNSGGIWVWRYALNVTTAPTETMTGGICASMVGNSRNVGLAYNTGDGLWYPGEDDGTCTLGSEGVALSAGWHLIDCRLDATSNPWLIDVRVDGTALAQLSRAIAGTTGGHLIAGNDRDTSSTFDYYVDDLSVSFTSADYPIGAGYVNHFVPTADGTHNVAGAADFRRGGTTTDITNATTDAYLLVDDVPLDDATPDTDDHIRIVAPLNATDYVELIFGPAPGISTPTTAPRAVEVICEVFAAGTGLSDEVIKLNDNGTLDNVYDGTGVAGVTTGTYKRKHYATPPTGGSWDVAGDGGDGDFLDLRLRYGYATDANPDKSLMCAMIEAEFPPAIEVIPYLVQARR